MATRYSCPVCKHTGTVRSQDDQPQDTQGFYKCSNCHTRFVWGTIRKYIHDSDYNTHKDHKVLNVEVTPGMRAESFEANGEYLNDQQIAAWFDRKSIDKYIDEV